MISYAPFWRTIKEKGVSTYALRDTHNISPSILTRLKGNKYISMRTVDDLCKILNCTLADIAEYIPENPNNDNFLSKQDT